MYIVRIYIKLAISFINLLYQVNVIFDMFWVPSLRKINLGQIIVTKDFIFFVF